MNEKHVCRELSFSPVSRGWRQRRHRLPSLRTCKAPLPALEFMDYVAPGNSHQARAGRRTVVLGYMKSCWRETIYGVGTVIVGAEDSMVHLSEVKASKVPCDTSRSRLVDRQVGESAATRGPQHGGDASTLPQVTLYGLSPVVETTGRGKLVVERLDVAGERHDVNLTPASVVRGKFYDFAKTSTDA